MVEGSGRDTVDWAALGEVSGEMDIGRGLSSLDGETSVS